MIEKAVYSNISPALLVLQPTGAVYTCPHSEVGYMAMAQANSELLVLAHSERLTAMAREAATLSLPSQSMDDAELGTATLLSSRMMTSPEFSTSLALVQVMGPVCSAGAQPSAARPLPQICTPPRLPGLA